MVIFVKYSNERAPAFRIRTEILEEDNARAVRKSAAAPEAVVHLARIQRNFELLQRDLQGTGILVNPCRKKESALWFPYRSGRTMEQRLDQLLAQGKTEELAEEIARYFARITGPGCGGSPGCSLPFSETEEFHAVFGRVSLPEGELCRAVSDIDLIFGNVIETKDGPELIDYEWTFVFPVPVRFLQYRCLYYYVYGNAARASLIDRDLFARFGISPQEQEEFARMERSFQRFMLDSYTPLWQQYDSVSEGVLEAAPLAARESAEKRRRTVEVYFDDGRGFGVWLAERYRIDREGPVALRIPVPQGTRALRFDPYGGPCLVRIRAVSQNGQPLRWTSNGFAAPNGDLIFDTEDPQIICPLTDSAPVCVEFLAQPLTGLVREQVLNQYGRIRWMEQTKAWRAYRKAKKLLGKTV